MGQPEAEHTEQVSSFSRSMAGVGESMVYGDEGVIRERAREERSKRESQRTTVAGKRRGFKRGGENKRRSRRRGKRRTTASASPPRPRHRSLFARCGLGVVNSTFLCFSKLPLRLCRDPTDAEEEER